MTEKRKTDRIATLNLFYILLNEEETPVHQGMGRTLNLSETGILLETHFPIEPTYTVMISIGLAEDLVDVKGKVVHFRQVEKDQHVTGIQFVSVTEEAAQVIKKFVQAFGMHFSAQEPTP